jgi:peroxiredoxin (alkyl hydroperoxide reductase subunit C)
VEQDLGPIPFPLIGDTNHELSRAFNVLKEDLGVALRGTFIINPSGTIVSAHINDLAVGRSVEETVRTLHAFHSGELTACEWNPGEKTLGPAG